MNLNGNLIGLSMSLCIKEIIEGKINIEQVEKIIARTKIETPEQLDSVIRYYRDAFWQRNPDRAERIVRAMYRAGKIEQPRVSGQPFPDINNGIWTQTETEIKPANPIEVCVWTI